MLRLRVASAAVLVPVLIAALLAGTPWLVGLIVLIAAVAGWEVFELLRGAGFPNERVLGVGLVVAIVGTAAVGGVAPGALVIAGAAIATAVVAFARRDPRDGFVSWMATLFGALYVGLLGFLVAVIVAAPIVPESSPLAGRLDGGRAWLLVAVLGVWAFDTAAFVVGRTWGRGRFLAHISPAKTWTGVIGGTVGTILVSVACVAALGREPWLGIVLGTLVAVAAQAGDVAESMLKRAAGAKDSGRLIPGHGGMLDRVDSFLFAGPAVYFFLQLLPPR